MNLDLDILRHPDLVGVREHHFARLEALFAGTPADDQVFCLAGLTAATNDPDWEAWLDGGLAWLVQRADLARDRDVFRPLLLSYDPFGVHFTDSLFGADVFLLEGGWQVRPLDSPVGELAAPDLEDHPTWQAARAFARRFLELDLAAVMLVLPTIASSLNIAVNLYGQRIIEALLVEPEAARRDLRVITDVLGALHRWYLENVPLERMQCIAAGGRTQPPGQGQLCGCTTHLLSPAVYEEFIAPLDEELLSVYPGGGLTHLCGAHTQHIPAWRAMRALRAVQTNDRASEDLRAYFEGLREDQILYIHPCDKMPWQEVVAITGGRRLVLCACPQTPVRRPGPG